MSTHCCFGGYIKYLSKGENALTQYLGVFDTFCFDHFRPFRLERKTTFHDSRNSNTDSE